MQVPINKQTQGGHEVYLVPGVAIALMGGEKKLIPNPAGNETCLYTTLEDAKAAIERAGFDAVYDGVTTVNMGQMARQKAQGLRPPRLTNTLHDQMKQKLLGLLTDREPQVVIAAVQALANWQYAPAIDPLCKQLGHSDPTVRREVAEALAALAPNSLPALKATYHSAVSSIEAHAPYVRAAVLASLQHLLEANKGLAANPQDATELLPMLVQGLADDHWLVRAQAATTAAFVPPDGR
jgi:hypothetical protein